MALQRERDAYDLLHRYLLVCFLAHIKQHYIL